MQLNDQSWDVVRTRSDFRQKTLSLESAEGSLDFHPSAGIIPCTDGLLARLAQAGQMTGGASRSSRGGSKSGR